MAEITVGTTVVLVDDEDVAKLAGVAWWMTPQGYAAGKIYVDGRRRTMNMHRFLMGNPSTSAIDHINRNRLDNRKANLRPCTDGENNRNRGKVRGCSSRHRGVSWNKRRKAWQVVVRESGKLKWKGFYESEEQAASIAAPHFAGIAL